MKLILIDYGAGNIKSIQFAFKRLGVNAILSNDTEEIKTADKIIFPGVGEANSAMKMLKKSGLDIVIPTLQQPLLGICLGMQLLCDSTEEGTTKGLGVFNVKVKRFSKEFKVPQMGWNTLQNLQSKLMEGISVHDYLYSVHSYYAEVNENCIAETKYGITYASALQKDNFYGVQFHPEKSGKVGEIILQNFLNL